MGERGELRLFVPWLVWAAFCTVLMWALPGQETIPYHLGYAGLAVAFGLDVWSTRKAYLALAGFTVVTGIVLVARAFGGILEWQETAEIPLMSLLMALMVWHVSNRHAALAVVTRLADREREQAERRERLVRVTSHEMRTPLTIATGYVDLLRAECPEDAWQSDLEVVHDELDRLARASDRLLRMFRYHEDLPISSTDLDTLLHRLGERWSVVGDRTWQVESSAGRALCSEDRVRACLDTLVENAVRYTDRGDVIRIFGRREGGQVVLGVGDSGGGLSPDQISAINDPGELLPDPGVPNDSRSQTGLGLSLVREVVESRGGSLRAGSSPEGGALVVLSWPLAGVNSMERLAGLAGMPDEAERAHGTRLIASPRALL